ncbi:Zinc finger protein glis1 [Saguinus oedipus]|uniref:Zinc finger protein glis1 n=1 Tax=Saguinus oedipus TaxID=9490 RepID=A0ABQ9VDF1_SAGOE|nr:Zinc finger protein glis1 [Saguinus oedipus]
MHCEVAEPHSDKRPKEALGALGPGPGPFSLGAHMAFRVTVSGGGCGDMVPRDLLARPPVPPPRTHNLLRPRSPRDYGSSKVAAAGKGESGPANVPGGSCGDSNYLASPSRARENLVELYSEFLSFSLIVWD